MKSEQTAYPPEAGSTNTTTRKATGSRIVLALTGALIGTMTLPTANAQTYQSDRTSSYYVSAPVVSVDPITIERTISHPVRQCTTETRYPEQRYDRRRPQENLFLPGLFGGIVGGLIGNQFGGGSGKKALTIAGALAGSSIARESARQHRRQPSSHEVCHTVYESEVVRDVHAYDVTYEYAGRLFTKRTSQHPGDSVSVRVALTPSFGET